MGASCIIAGGGPAGMMLGLLLARAGVRVQVFEKHADFLRDFRGDTIHPSTLEVMHELGLLDAFLALPHQEATAVSATVGDRSFQVADFTHLPTRCRFVAFMPQWDFLNFLVTQARRLPAFQLEMQAEVTGIIEAGERVSGVRVTTSKGEGEEQADLVIAADGRHSTVRAAARLEVQELGAPMDVLWFRLRRAPQVPGETMGRFDAGRIFIAINRGEYWQCGYVIPKGSFEDIRARGLEAFRAAVAAVAPFAAAHVAEIQHWEDVNLLTVQVDRLVRWYRPGLLCIGDAAHAMSPVGGVGINLAIQDAVAAANLLAGRLRAGRVDVEDLRRVQQRREWPTRVTQWVQVQIQQRVIAAALAERGSLQAPLPVRLLDRYPLLRRLPGRMVGLGVRPEHVRVAGVPAG
jgi:2-polyprenyl-6-methoxyphenol hydroxylase-like FAD-dependent oxidoreductase